MFKKSERLSRSLFTHYFKVGKRSNSPHITVVYSEHKQLHVSVVVGKKVCRKAHDRNKLRRRVYGKLYTLLKSKKTGIFVVIVKPSFAGLTKSEQGQEVQNILSRITLSPIS